MKEETMEQFQTLIDDAQANFETARYRDAARGFEYISQFCLDHEKINDSIYFLYRTAIAWSLARTIEEPIKLFKSVGLFFMDHARHLCQQAIRSDRGNKIRILEHYQAILDHFNRPQERKEILIKLIEYYERKASNDLSDPSMEKAIKYSLELKNEKKTTQLIKKLAENYIHEANEMLSSEYDDRKEVSIKLLEKVLSLAKRTENDAIVNQMTGLINQINSH